MAGEPTKPNSSADITAQKPHSAQFELAVAGGAAVGGRGYRRLCRQGAGDVAAPATGARGRLVFALDATMSRQPTWDMACALQADMFREAASIGSLDIRLVYYRGLNECRATAGFPTQAQLAQADEQDRGARAATPRSARCCRSRGARRSPRPCARWCSSATPWKRASTTSAPRPVNSACSRCRYSCSRKATTPARRTGLPRRSRG